MIIVETECGKKMSNIFFIGLKKDLFGCFRIEEIRGKYNETGLEEGGGIEMSTTVLPFTITINISNLKKKHFLR